MREHRVNDERPAAPTPLAVVPLLGTTQKWSDVGLPAVPLPPHESGHPAALHSRWAVPERSELTGWARAGAPQDGEIDWGLVRALRSQAASELSASIADAGVDDDLELGSRIIDDLLAAHMTAQMGSGGAAPTPGQTLALRRAVLDALFGMGRLQPLVDDPDIENIEVTGYDDVKLTHPDGSVTIGAPVADSDEELIEALQFLAARSAAGARPFSPAHPFLHLQLPGGGRLAASAWVLPRPSLVIRIHRLREVTLPDLVTRDLLDEPMAEFLAAAVRAGKSIVVSGPQGSGKTTLVRALCACLDPWERIATLETERELFLHELPEAHRRVLSWESRPGSGDRGPDGRPQGQVTLGEVVEASLRFNISRLIVGEVRGSEVLAMFQAMQTGAGSMSTTHAHSARAAIERLVTCALEAGPHVTGDFAHRQVAEHIDLIVQVSLKTWGSGDRPVRHRYISEVIAVEPGESGRAATTTLWSRSGPERRPRVGVLPVHLMADLAEHGYQPGPAAGAA